MKISVVIPAFNEEKLIADTLRSVHNALDAFAAADWTWELIVCDNNSTDGTAEIARRNGAQVVFEAENQISRARNAGAAAATGDWILFIDADTQPSFRLFANVRRLILRGDHLAAGANIRFHTDAFWALTCAHFWNWTSRMLSWAAGSFFLVRADVFRELKGFSNELYVSEELDLSIRLNRLAAQRSCKSLHIFAEPLIDTSGRKVDLYSGTEHFRFFIKSITSGMGLLRCPKTCHLWYDGRR